MKFINLLKKNATYIYQDISTFAKCEGFKKAFLISFGIYMIALFALFRGNVYYIDDWSSSSHNLSWNHFSRFLMTIFINKFASVFKSTAEISPLMQIFGVAFIILGGMILIYLIRRRFDMLGIIALLPLGLSPHFLENLSYKFESIGMGAAVFFCIMPFLFKERKVAFVIMSILGLLCMYMSYQAANGIYIVLALYFTLSLYFLEGRSAKNTLGFLMLSMFSFIAASVIYKKLIVIPVSTYVSDSMLPLSELINGGGANLWRYLSLLFNDLCKVPYFQLSIILVFIFIIAFSAKSARSKKLVAFIAIAFIIVALCLSYGIYFVLQKPLFEPRAFMGFGAFVALLCISSITLLDIKNPKNITANRMLGGESRIKDAESTLDSNNSIKSTPTIISLKHRICYYLTCTIVCIMSYFLVTFALAYGNAITKQNEYIMFRSELLVQDLLKVSKEEEKAGIKLQGYIGYALPTEHFRNKYGGISRLIPAVMNAPTWYWSYSPLRHLKAPFLDNPKACEAPPREQKLLLSHRYHSIALAGNCYIITLKP